MEFKGWYQSHEFEYQDYYANVEFQQNRLSQLQYMQNNLARQLGLPVPNTQTPKASKQMPEEFAWLRHRINEVSWKP